MADVAIILALLVYKVSCLAVGSLFCWLGYRLFTLGITANAGDLDAGWKGAKLRLRSAAPGTFFAVLGASIVIFTLIKGMDLDRTQDAAPLTSPTSAMKGNTP